MKMGRFGAAPLLGSQISSDVQSGYFLSLDAHSSRTFTDAPMLAAWREVNEGAKTGARA